MDGQAYRILGGNSTGSEQIPAMPQLAPPLVLPTSTVYNFSDGRILIALTFLSPMKAEDITTMVPLTYVIWDVYPLDGKDHRVQLYFDFDAELCVNDVKERVVWNRPLPSSSSVEGG